MLGDPVKISRRLAEQLGFEHACGELGELFAVAPTTAIEWGLGQDADGSSELAVTSWLRSADAAAGGARFLGQTPAAELLGALSELLGLASLGLVISDRAARYQVGARVAHAGDELCRRLPEVVPLLVPASQLFADECGGPGALRGLAFEVDAGQMARLTLFARVASPAQAIRLLEFIGPRVTDAAMVFFAGACGLAEGTPWPPVWVSRSIGRGAGWTFHYFADGDPHRRSDRVLLDTADADDDRIEAWRVVRGLAPADQREIGVVRQLSLTFDERDVDAPPRWTIQLATGG